MFLNYIYKFLRFHFILNLSLFSFREHWSLIIICNIGVIANPTRTLHNYLKKI